MRNLITALCLAALILPAGCSTISVETDFDPDVDFSRFKTYSWVTHVKQPEGRMMRDPLIRKHVQRAVENELEAKGYTKYDGEPDFLVAFHIGSKRKVDVDHYYYRYGRWGRFRGHDVSVHRYREGTLIVDIVDAGAKELVWRGWAKSVLHGRDDVAEDIEASVARIMERFPPEQASR